MEPVRPVMESTTGIAIHLNGGREAFLAGRMLRKRFASASSPIDGTVF